MIEFQDVVDGVNLTINEGTKKPVTVNVKTTNTALTTAIGEFVDSFNSIRGALDEMTAFDAETLTTGILFGTREALRVEADPDTVKQTLAAAGVRTYDRPTDPTCIYVDDPDGRQVQIVTPDRVR